MDTKRAMELAAMGGLAVKKTVTKVDGSTVTRIVVGASVVEHSSEWGGCGCYRIDGDASLRFYPAVAVVRAAAAQGVDLFKVAAVAAEGSR